MTLYVNAIAPVAPAKSVSITGAVLSQNGYYDVTAAPYGAVGDGVTDDRTAILAALNAASANGGGTVYFPKATYQLSGSTLNDYITIAGSQYNHITLRGAPGAVWQITSSAVKYALLLQNVTDFRIVGLKFAYATQPTIRDDTGPKCVRLTGCTDTVIERVEVSGSPQYGIAVETSTRPVMRGCHVHDTMADGINFNSCYKNTAVQNRVHHTGDDGISLSTPLAAPAGQRNEDSVIAENVIYYTNQRGVFALAEGCTITGNAIADTSAANIGCVTDYSKADPGLRAKDITISGNTCIRANTIVAGTGPNGTNRSVAGATAGGGSIFTASQNGTAFNTTQAHENITIAGNTIDSPARCAIMVQSTNGANIVGNSYENPCTMNDASYLFGVYVLSCNWVNVVGVTARADSVSSASVRVDTSGGVIVKHINSETGKNPNVTSTTPKVYDTTFFQTNYEETTFGRFSANLMFTTGSFAITTAGQGFQVKEGTNAKMGVATLTAGAVTVSTTAVTANSRIFLTGQNSSGTAGELTVSARTAGTSFVITSSSGTDTRQIAWFIVEPA